MGDEMQLLDEVDPWIMSAYIYYSALLCLKILSNAFLTAITRMRTGIPSNPEDRDSRMLVKQPTANHPNLVRVQRMHQNDMENILPFLFIGLIFCMTMRGYNRAIWHFRVFFSARILHSICHYFAIMPFRSIFWIIAFGVNVSLAGHILWKAGLDFKFI